jgi:hypothetical protein
MAIENRLKSLEQIGQPQPLQENFSQHTSYAQQGAVPKRNVGFNFEQQNEKESNIFGDEEYVNSRTDATGRRAEGWNLMPGYTDLWSK